MSNAGPTLRSGPGRSCGPVGAPPARRGRVGLLGLLLAVVAAAAGLLAALDRGVEPAETGAASPETAPAPAPQALGPDPSPGAAARFSGGTSPSMRCSGMFPQPLSSQITGSNTSRAQGGGEFWKSHLELL